MVENTKAAKRSRMKKIIFTMGGIWLGLIAALVIWGLSNEYRSDPLAPRPWAEADWNARMREAYRDSAEHPLAVAGPAVDPLPDGKLKVQFPIPNPGTPAQSIVHVDPETQRVQLSPSLSVSLKSLAVGYRLESGFQKQAFMAPDFEPANNQQLQDALIDYFDSGSLPNLETWTVPSSGQAELRFYIGAESKSASLSFGDFMLFDPNTKVGWRPRRWDSVADESGDRQGAQGQFRFYRFHDRPLLLALSIAHGPPETLSLEPKPNTVATGRQFTCNLVALRAAQAAEFLWSERASGKEVEVEFISGRSPSRTTVLLVAISGDHQASPWFARIETKSGEEATAPLIGSQLAWARFPGIPPSEIARIDIQIPQHKELIFTLPRIPGMPDRNSEPGNLFSVKAPHLEIRDPTDLQNLLRDGAQYDGWVEAPELPENWLPRTYQGVSVRRVIDDYLRHVKEPYHLDPEAFTLQETDQPKWRLWIEDRWTRAKGWIGK